MTTFLSFLYNSVSSKSPHTHIWSTSQVNYHWLYYNVSKNGEVGSKIDFKGKISNVTQLQNQPVIYGGEIVGSNLSRLVMYDSN